MKKGVTMREIGAALGVSTVTISKALSGKEGVSDAVREKIIKTAQQMGYHYVAPAASEKQESMIGILIADRFFSAASFYASLYKELVKQMMEGNMLGVLEIVSAGKERELTLPAIIADRRVSALILLGQFDPAYVERMMDEGLPTVLLDFYCDGPDVDAVVSDGQSGCYLLTRHLIERGHKRIAFVGSAQRTTSIMDRYSGYLRAMMFAGLTVEEGWLVDDRDSSGKYLTQLTLPQPLPTAFVCNNDQVAMRLVAQLEAMGVRVPQDISVTGFDNFIYATLCVPALTTYTVDQERMAQVAIRRLQSRIRDGAEGPIRTIVGGWVVERESTCARAEKQA
ncbi:MAG TPA: LacI family DNA-binding transcriptional regulator [Candidatus Ventricola intestinavium]|nr:LacI family DNA-binding transcriptional regulator [Candidatus Ventricola intestinavium]